MATSTTELRLHREVKTAWGGAWIWFTRQNQVAAYPLAIADFVSQEWVQEASAIRLLGTAENAPLIEELYRSRHLTGKPASIQLGSPGLCIPERESVTSAATIFQRMDALARLRPSVGGWHELTHKDYVSYALTRAVYDARGAVTGVAEKFLATHPAWPALSFLPTLNKTRAALLLALLVDPRWHVDPQRPDRAAKLKAAFGLGGRHGDVSPVRIIQAVLDETVGKLPPAVAGRAAKVQVALDTWAGMDRDPDPQDVVCDPRNFLWRIATRENTRRAVGLLRASHVFLRFVSDFWISQVQRYPAASGEDLFVPAYFFQDAEVVDAWNVHRQTGGAEKDLS